MQSSARNHFSPERGRSQSSASPETGHLGGVLVAEGHGPAPTTARPEHGRLRPRAEVADDGEQPARLGNHWNSSPAIHSEGDDKEKTDAEERRREARSRRFSLRKKARKAEQHRPAGRDMHGVAGCGHAVRRDAHSVDVRLSPQSRAGFAGLVACGSVWACPVCAAKVGARRAEELGDVLGWARAQQHTVALLTLTVRHNRKQELGAVWDAVSSGWSQITSGSQWGSETQEAFDERLVNWYLAGKESDAHRAAGLTQKTGARRAPRGWRTRSIPQRRVGDAERYGVLGWARVAEVTRGNNGWHVHIHVVLVLEGAMTRNDLDPLAESIWGRWEKGISKEGFTALRRTDDRGTGKSKDLGLDLRVAESATKKLAEYLEKATDPIAQVRSSVEKRGRDLAREATLGHNKAARSESSRTPFQILDDSDYCSNAMKLWHDWIEGSWGRRQLTWSQGLRELAGLAAEAADEEVAAEELGSQEDTVVSIYIDSWCRIREFSALLLNIVETRGVSGLCSQLHEWGVAFQRVRPDSSD